MKASFITYIQCALCEECTSKNDAFDAIASREEAVFEARDCLGWVEIHRREHPFRPATWLCRECAEDVAEALSEEGAPS